MAEVPASACNGYVSVLRSLLDDVERERALVTAGAGPEHLHELRIAIRRTRTVLRSAMSVLPPDVIADARATFARIAERTGSMRDLDVWLDGGRLDRVPPDLASDLGPMRDELERRRAAARERLVADLSASSIDDVLRAWRTQLASVSEHRPAARRAHEPLGRIVAKRIRRSHRRVVCHGRAIGPQTPASELHELRKEAKRLRYLVECFEALAPKRARRRYLERLKPLLSSLGAHQDAEVQRALVADVARTLHSDAPPVETLLALGRLQQLLVDDQRAARSDVMRELSRFGRRSTRRRLRDLIRSTAP